MDLCLKLIEMGADVKAKDGVSVCTSGIMCGLREALLTILSFFLCSRRHCYTMLW